MTKEEIMKRKKEEILKIFNKCIEKRGKEVQSRQAMEECAELIQAINKCLRYPKNNMIQEDLIGEIADVLIMIYQLKVMFNISEEDIAYMIELKAKREEVRL